MTSSSLTSPPRPVRRGSSFGSASTPAKAQFRSKFSVSYDALLSGDHPWLNPNGSASSSLSGTPSLSAQSGATAYFSPSGKKPSAPRVRFYADLLCLKVEPHTIERLLASVSARQLTNDDEGSKGARIRDNVGSLWRECLRVWTDVPSTEDAHVPPSFNNSSASDEVRRVNAVDTLIALSKNILVKNFAHSSSSLDLIWIFAGGIDEADDVFEELVSAIDEGLRGELDNVAHQRRTTRPTRLPSSLDQDASLRHQQRAASLNDEAQELPTLKQLLYHRLRSVHLAIVWISHASATNLSAYFVRRDLFVGACSLLNTIQAIVRSTQSSGLVDLADEDAEFLRTVVRDTNLLLGLMAGLGQSGGVSSSDFKAIEASTSPYFRRMCDWVDSNSMHLIRDAASMELEQTWQAYEVADAQGTSAQGITASFGAVTEGLRKMSVTNSNEAESLSPGLPPPTASTLLPIYLLCRANPVIVEVFLKRNAFRQTTTVTDDQNKDAHKEENQKTSFAASLMTVSSYLATHGSFNSRSRTYSRLALLVNLTLLNSPAGIQALLESERDDDTKTIKMCAQRSGPLPMRSHASSSAEQQGLSLTAFFAQFNPLGGSGRASFTPRKRLLPFVLDICSQYLRHNLRKRLDMSGYLICLQNMLLSIQICAEQRILLEYSEWPDVWSTVSSTIAFLVGRHTELHGVEIGKLGQALLSILSLALLESDRFLASHHDVNILIYELVRSSEALRRLAVIVAFGKETSEQEGNTSSRTIASALPVWRLLDLTLSSFDDKLREWAEKKASRGVFGMNFSLTSLPGYSLLGRTNADGQRSEGEHQQHRADTFGGGGNSKTSSGTSTPNGGNGGGSAAAWSGRMPDVQTVLQLISSMDLEQIAHVYRMENEGRGRGGAASSYDGGNGSSIAVGSNRGIASMRSKSSVDDTSKSMLIDEEWLERAESQCFAEAFRFASEDMRTLLESM